MENASTSGTPGGRSVPIKQFWRAAPFALLLLSGLLVQPCGAGAQGLSADQQLTMLLNSNRESNESADAGAGARGRWVSVVQFRFTGNTLFASKALAAVLADDLNRPLDFSELHALADKVANFYRVHGARALVVVPAQDISSRKITFVVVEALPGKLPMEARLSPKTPSSTRIA